MKSIVSFFLFFTLASAIHAQDVVWGVNTSKELIRFRVNTSTNPFTLTPTNGSVEIGSNVLTRSSAACGIYGDYIYYIPYGDGSEGEEYGQFDVRSIKTDGTNDSRKINDFDLNGSNNYGDLSFVRLGFDKSGVGWIVAKGSGSTFYVGKFTAGANGSASNPTVVGTFTITGGSSLGSGDLAFDDYGNMFLLVNTNSGTNVSIYVLSPTTLGALPTTLSTPNWTLKSPTGGNFSAIVNGIAFASNGSLYISDGGALYYVDATTINNPGPGDVQVKTITNTGNNSVDDLATLYFPPTSLPVEFGAISAEKTNNQLKVSWQALQEKGVKDYVVEASADGENWTAIGKVDSKGVDGNSGQPLQYELIINISGMAVAGLGLAFLLLPLFRSRTAKIVLVLAIVAGGLAACTKDDTGFDVSEIEHVWIRIIQHDINGGTTVSKVIKAVDRQ